MSDRSLFYDFTFDQLQQLLADLGQPSYRAAQIFEWAYRKDASSFAAMTNLPTALRADLAARLDIGPAPPRAVSSDSEAEKLLLPMPGGGEVECVAMRMDGYRSACLSTQVGCRAGCVFCATGMSGWERNLSAGEIILQLMTLRARVGNIRNVVYMGMGEAFYNYDAVLASIHLLTDKRALGLSPGHITVSTAGVVPAIYRYAREGPPTELTVSLNASDQQTRDLLMPGMARWDLADLIAACAAFSEARSGQPVTFAYVLIEGVNDRFEDAERLAVLLRPLPHHLNLIPLNPVAHLLPPPPPADRGPTSAPGPSQGRELLRSLRRPNPYRVQAFYRACRRLGLNASVRRSKGCRIDAACGQLRRRTSSPPTSPGSPPPPQTKRAGS